MQREVDLGRWFGSVEVGRPACVFADEVEDTRNTIEQLAASEPEGARVVALTWHHVPSLGNELGLLVDALARATLELFPSLYGGSQRQRERWTSSDIEQEAHEVTRRVSGVQAAICREILGACKARRVPEVKGLPSSELVRQLALAIEPARLVVLICVVSSEGAEPRLRSLAQGAEWLAANSGGRVVVILPSGFRAAMELDHLTYGACAFLRSGGHSAPAQPSPPGDRSPAKAAIEPRGPAPILADVYVSPLVGRPHPRSEAENELYRHLAADPELRSVFEYNQPVATRYASMPTVDLVWQAGRLAIEIDGHDHRGERKFAQDRKRDYELTMSGYHVVRFTSSRVLEDPRAVVEQIRDAVRYFGSREMK